MTHWDIRPVTAADLDAVYAIFAACISPCWKKETFAARLDHPCAVVLAAWEGERPVGFADGECAFGLCELNNIAVLPNCRRRGAGNALLLALGQEAKQRDCTAISWRCGSPTEPPWTFIWKRICPGGAAEELLYRPHGGRFAAGQTLARGGKGR